MAAIVRVAVVAITIALFAGSALNAVSGQRELAVVFALAAPLGISAWGFARGGHHEAAVVLLCTVLTVVSRSEERIRPAVRTPSGLDIQS
jgi:hypothetical protein